MRDIRDFISGILYMATVLVLLTFNKCQELYFIWRKIPYKRTNEGFVVRIK